LLQGEERFRHIDFQVAIDIGAEVDTCWIGRHPGTDLQRQDDIGKINPQVMVDVTFPGIFLPFSDSRQQPSEGPAFKDAVEVVLHGKVINEGYFSPVRQYIALISGITPCPYTANRLKRILLDIAS